MAGPSGKARQMKKPVTELPKDLRPNKTRLFLVWLIIGHSWLEFFYCCNGLACNDANASASMLSLPSGIAILTGSIVLLYENDSRNAAPVARRHVDWTRLLLVNGLPANKPHCDLVRAVLRARSADPIHIRALSTRPDVIGVEPGDVGHSGSQHAVAINVDAVRGSSIPGEVHPLLPLHLVAARTERDLPRCHGRRSCWRHTRCCGGCRCSCWSRSSCRCGCRCRRRCRCRCWCRANARRLDLNRHGRARLKVTYCCVHTLRRLVSVKPEIVQCAPANRIGVLILR